MSAVAKVAKKDLSLAELMDCAYEQIDQYRSLLGQARQSREDATLAIFRAGEWLSLARKKFKADGRGKWTAFLKEYGIPRTTAWEAEELFRRAKTEEAVSRMTPTEAKRHFGVVKEKEAMPTPTSPFPSVKASRTTNSSNGNVASLPMTPHRPGDPPSDPDRDGRQSSDVPARPKPAPERFPTPAGQENSVVEGDACSEPDTEPATTPADEPPTPGEEHLLLTTIVQIVRRLEETVEDLAKFDLAVEPKDDIGREIDQGIAILTKLKGEIDR